MIGWSGKIGPFAIAICFAWVPAIAREQDEEPEDELAEHGPPLASDADTTSRGDW